MKIETLSLFTFLLILIIFFITIFINKIMLPMPGSSYRGPLLPLTAEELEIRENLIKSVLHLCQDIGERNIGNIKNLELAENYIEQEFKKFGLTVTKQPYQIKNVTLNNIVGEKKGTERPDEIVVIGAHYDTVDGTGGADDNASGVSGMIEIARLLSKQSYPQTIQFVAFSTEEPPFFYTENMGSWQFANAVFQNKIHITVMISLESIGFYSDKVGSQRYPFPLGYFYPNTGNFIGFVGNLDSRQWVHKMIGSFRKYTKFPSEGLASPSWVPGVFWSDQWSFWKHGYPAIMITSTAPFRNPNYHTGRDLANTLDYDRMARVVLGISLMISDINK